MDLIFSKYSSPFFYIQTMLDMGTFSLSVDELFKKENDKKLWELYLHSMPTKSFNDWKNDVLGKQNVERVEVSVEELEATKKNSKDILKSFKPY